MSFDFIVTDAGRAALVNAQNTGTAPVTIAQVGISATAIAAGPGTVALPNEIKRIAGVPGQVVADDTIHINMTDGGADTYALRSIALYLADGTLFAAYSQPGPILAKTGASIALLAIDIVFADISAALITFGDAEFTNPPATTEVQGVVELATQAEADAGTDTTRALVPARARAALLPWLLAQDGSGSGLDADLLDGQHGSYYTNIVARLGYTPLNSALFTAAEILSRLITADGSGSGLDADLWRGKNPTQFIADMFQTGSNANGRWWKMPDGAGGTVIEQQGSYGAINVQQATLQIVFPTAFTNTDYDLQLTAIIPAAGDYDNFIQEISGTRTVNGVSVFSQDPSSGGSSNLAGFRWRAKGY